MKAIIMAGGEGRRLSSISGGCPKPMMPIVGRPVMEHIVNLLRAGGFTDICASLRFGAEDIREYFGDGSRFGVSMEYRVEDEPLGTAGGVKNCEGFYGDGDFLVISGDAACDFDLKKLMDEHRRASPAVTLALYPHAEPLSYGLVLTDRHGEVVSFVEKPRWGRVVTNLVNTGIYVVSPRAMKDVPENTPFDFAKDLFPLLLERGESLRGLAMDGYWRDIGTPEAYFTCNLDALRGTLRLQGTERTEPESLRPEPKEQADAVYFCADRAALMRAMSERLMEAGADFTDGITVDGRGGKVRIRPAEHSSAIIFDGPEGLARSYAKLAEKLDVRE